MHPARQHEGQRQRRVGVGCLGRHRHRHGRRRKRGPDHLARRGLRTLGLDRFQPGHARGSSHGDTRVIRQCYFEHPDYIPLLLRAYELWADLEQRTARRLYQRTGVLEIGPTDGMVLPGVMAAAARHNLSIDSLEPANIRRRFPGFDVPEGMAGVFEHDAGILYVEDCVLAHTRAAQAAGAQLEIGPAVLGFERTSSGFRVATESTTHECTQLVVTPGAWAADLLGMLGLRLEVRRKVLLWYGAERYETSPVYLYELPSGIFYGFPQVDGAVKVAEHSGGGPAGDPLNLDRELHRADVDPVERFLSDHLPGADATDRQRHAVCMYTMTPDDHFVIDHDDGLAYACGLSGHGFKFASVLGEILADLATTGATPLPIGMFSSAR